MIRNKIVKIFYTAFLFACPFISSGQENLSSETDSLLTRSDRFIEKNTDSFFTLAFKAAELSQRMNDYDRLARSYKKIAEGYKKADDADQTIAYYEKADDAVQHSDDKKLKAEIALALGGAYFDKGKYDMAFTHLRQAKTLSEKLNDYDLEFMILYDFSSLYMHPDYLNLDSAFPYCNRSLHLAKEKNDTDKLARALRNMSHFYVCKKQWEEAMSYTMQALELARRIDDPGRLAIIYKDIGDLYYYQEEGTQAIEYYARSYELNKSLNNIAWLAIGSCDLAYMYAVEKKTDMLEKYAEESYRLAMQTKSWSNLKYIGRWLSEAYELAGNDKKALYYYKIYYRANDSINDRATIEKTSRAEMQNAFESKVQQMKLEEEKQKVIAQEEERNQKRIRNILIIGFCIAILLLFLTYRSYVQKRKANIIVSRQKDEVELQKVKIEEKNKQITDSINYAKLIQRAILPDPKEIMKVFPNSFGLYRPRDVVSGDFYWFSKKDGAALIAAADCTGHGVPGALMSMIGIDKLNQAVVASHITRPDEILSFVNFGVKATLKQNNTGQSSRDGMDIALCSFDFKNNMLLFSGANRPLWLIRNGKLLEYKPTKMSIGGMTSTGQVFHLNEIRIQKDDTIYIFTDGYADQFGGDMGKKMMTKNYKKFLLSIQHVPILDQEKILEEKLMEWQAGHEQVDDILIIGIRV